MKNKKLKKRLKELEWINKRLLRNLVVMRSALKETIKQQPQIELHQWLFLNLVNYRDFMKLLMIIWRAEEKKRPLTVEKLTKKWYRQVFGKETAAKIGTEEVDEIREMLQLMARSGQEGEHDAAKYVLNGEKKHDKISN